jgi:uncharacterized membrane protein required for colicin V production
VIDLVLAAVLLAGALIGFRRGFLNMLGQLVMLLIPLAAAFLMLDPASAWLTRLPFPASWRERLAEPVLAPLAASLISAQEAIESFLLPPLLAVWMSIRLPDASTDLDRVLPEMSDALFHFLVSGLSFLLLFILISLVVRITASYLTRFSDRVPVLGTANRLGGLAVGLLTSCVILAVLFLLAGVAAPWFPDFANLISQSRVAGYFYSVNFLADFF